MSIKRFVQLFCFYFLSIVVSYSFIIWLDIAGFWGTILIMSVIGYIVLTLPLTLLTLKKRKKKSQRNNRRLPVSHLVDQEYLYVDFLDSPNEFFINAIEIVASMPRLFGYFRPLLQRLKIWALLLKIFGNLTASQSPLKQSFQTTYLKNEQCY